MTIDHTSTVTVASAGPDLDEAVEDVDLLVVGGGKAGKSLAMLRALGPKRLLGESGA